MINILAKANTNHKSIGMGLNPFLLKTTHTKCFSQITELANLENDLAL